MESEIVIVPCYSDDLRLGDVCWLDDHPAYITFIYHDTLADLITVVGRDFFTGVPVTPFPFHPAHAVTVYTTREDNRVR